MSVSMRVTCPECGSWQFKRNGHIHNGKQNHRCKACGRQFILDAITRVINQEHRPLGERLLCEKVSLRGICRTIGVSMRWLMDFLGACFATVPEHLHVQPVASSGEVLLGCREVEADEL
jgi:transposase-like protein